MHHFETYSMWAAELEVGAEKPSPAFEKLLQEGGYSSLLQKIEKVRFRWNKYFLIVTVFEGFEKQDFRILSVVEDIFGMP